MPHSPRERAAYRLQRLERACELMSPSYDILPTFSDPRHLPFRITSIPTSPTSISLTNATTSPLLRLPQHIRDLILHPLCHSGGIIYLGRPTPLRHKTLPLRFLRTCRQIRLEATKLLYELNIFAITSPADAYRLLSSDSHTIANLRDVRLRNVNFNEPCWHQVLNELLPQMTQLRTLEIGCEYGSSQQGVLDLFGSFDVEEGGGLRGRMVLGGGLEKVVIRMAEKAYREVWEDARDADRYGLRPGGALVRRRAVRIEVEEEEEGGWG